MALLIYSQTGKIRLIARETVDDAITAKEVEHRRRVMYHKMAEDLQAAIAAFGYQADFSVEDFGGPDIKLHFEGDTGGPEGLK